MKVSGKRVTTISSRIYVRAFSAEHLSSSILFHQSVRICLNAERTPCAVRCAASVASSVHSQWHRHSDKHTHSDERRSDAYRHTDAYRHRMPAR